MLNRSDRKVQSWREALHSYNDIRLFYIFLLGCSSGFPWVLVGSSMSGWLSDAGLSRAAIGYFGSVMAVYSINFLWAPLVDRFKVPFLSLHLGQRRSWIILMQGLMLCATLSIAFTSPAQSLLWTSMLALMITTFSATQDIAIDAYRIDIIGDDKLRLPPAAAMATIGWWTGYSLPGYIAFHNADTIGWSTVYMWMAAIMGLMMVFTLLVKEPKTEREALQKIAEQHYDRRIALGSGLWHTFLVRVSVTVVEPFAEFFRRNGWQLACAVLAFVFLFKIGEAFLGRMSIVFYRDVGFSNEQIAEYSKMIGWFLTIFFTLVGSAINIRYGIVRGLFIGGVAMAASNLMFAWMAVVGPNEALFMATIVVDNFTSAFSSVAFVSFISWLSGRAFSATQYALLVSVGSLGRTTLSSFSGEMVDALNGNWPLFFMITSLMVIPGLILLVFIGRAFSRREARAAASAEPAESS